MEPKAVMVALGRRSAASLPRPVGASRVISARTSTPKSRGTKTGNVPSVVTSNSPGMKGAANVEDQGQGQFLVKRSKRRQPC